MRVLAHVAALILVFTPLAALAKDADPALAADEVRKTLPPPNPALAFTYQGDLVQGELWAGEVEVEAKAHKFGGTSVWKITETYFVDMGGAEMHYTASYHLNSDLSLSTGSAESRHRGRTVSIFFGRSKTGLRVMRKITPAKGEATSETLNIEAPRNATYGEAAVLLFARGLPANGKTAYALPWAPVLELALARQEGAPACTTLSLTPRGKAKAKTPKATHDTFDIGASRSELAYALHLTPDRTQIVALSPEQDGQLSWVPRGEGGERIQMDEEKPAETWQTAFLKFGYGYHMAREELIEAAFHWPSMWEYESKVVKSWDPRRDVDEFKAAWIQEFLAGSLHRTRAATDRLLSMTLSTGKVKKETKTEIVFAAHANFGGGVQRTYHLKKIDGLWYLWRIDF